jgi:hypothetical protein
MRKYLIERVIPGAGGLAAADLQAISAKSNGVIRELGPDVQWVHSYVAGDKVFCVYNAKSPELVREHARRGGFPCDRVHEVTSVIDPTSEQTLARKEA